eukprot:841569_1
MNSPCISSNPNESDPSESNGESENNIDSDVNLAQVKTCQNAALDDIIATRKALQIFNLLYERYLNRIVPKFEEHRKRLIQVRAELFDVFTRTRQLRSLLEEHTNTLRTTVEHSADQKDE